jgi:hypothetical protein
MKQRNRKIKKNDEIKDILKEVRKNRRNDEIQNFGKLLNRTKIATSKKIYSRKKKGHFDNLEE